MPKINKWGNSQGIRLEKNKLEEAGFFVEEEVAVEYMPDTVIIRKIKRLPSSIYQLFEGYSDQQDDMDLVDFGNPVGEEEWK